MDLHLHDLRHTGSTWSAQSGATLRELMSRIGHSSTRAAMIYLHGSDERQRAIADAISRRATSEFKPNGRTNRAHSGHETTAGHHEDHSGEPQMAGDLGFLERAWQDSNPRPAA